MSTTPTIQRRQIRKGALAGQAMSNFAFQMPAKQREAMQILAQHRGWSEAEALRRAVALFLDQNRDLLQVLCPDLSEANSRGQ